MLMCSTQIWLLNNSEESAVLLGMEIFLLTGGS